MYSGYGVVLFQKLSPGFPEPRHGELIVVVVELLVVVVEVDVEVVVDEDVVVELKTVVTVSAGTAYVLKLPVKLYGDPVDVGHAEVTDGQ
jgi:hypothetical protein